MTTHNTEPKPATDEDIEKFKEWTRASGGIQMLSSDNLPSLFARIEQEREMRREATKVFEAVNAAIAFGLMAELRPYHSAWQGINDSVMAALARAAKMEEDYGK